MAANVQAVWAGDYRAMGAAARAHVVSRFSWERTFAPDRRDLSAAQARCAERRSGRFGWLMPQPGELAHGTV
jgi:hypothetical protein